MASGKRVIFDYRTTVDMVESYIKRGRKPSGEMFFEATKTMVPPLLPSDMQAVLTKELDPTMKRSGRPSSKEPSRHDVAGVIEQIDRGDLPPGFRNALVARLRSGKRFSNFDRDKPLYRHLEKSRWHMTIKYLYNCLYDLIGVNNKTVWFEPIGEIEIPSDRAPRSDKAMMMAHNVLSNLGMHPPTVRRMFNIKSEIPRPFRER